jgi:hypothetical protein
MAGTCDKTGYGVLEQPDAIFAPRLLLTLWHTDRLVTWVPKHSQAFYTVFQLLSDASDAAHG